MVEPKNTVTNSESEDGVPLLDAAGNSSGSAGGVADDGIGIDINTAALYSVSDASDNHNAAIANDDESMQADNRDNADTNNEEDKEEEDKREDSKEDDIDKKGQNLSSKHSSRHSNSSSNNCLVQM